MSRRRLLPSSTPDRPPEVRAVFAAIAAAEEAHPGFEYVTREDLDPGRYLLRRNADGAPIVYVGIGTGPGVTPNAYYATLLRALDELNGVGVVRYMFPQRRTAAAGRRVGH